MKFLMNAKSIVPNLVIFIMCGLQMGCQQKIIDIPIHKSNFIINKKGIVFQCRPPLKRQLRTASIRIALADNFTVEPPWTAIKLVPSSEYIILNVRIITSNDKIYKANIFGRAGGMLDCRFDPQLSKGIQIKRIEISSNRAIECHELIWHDFNSN